MIRRQNHLLRRCGNVCCYDCNATGGADFPDAAGRRVRVRAHGPERLDSAVVVGQLQRNAGIGLQQALNAGRKVLKESRLYLDDVARLCR